MKKEIIYGKMIGIAYENEIILEDNAGNRISCIILDESFLYETITSCDDGQNLWLKGSFEPLAKNPIFNVISGGLED